jgi:GNAT superfamily N-acetyltransferase
LGGGGALVAWTHLIGIQEEKRAKFSPIPFILSMTVTVRILQPSDIGLVASAAPGVFDHAPQIPLATEFLNDPWHHLVAAIGDGQMVGFISAMHYVHPDKPVELWINEIGVAPSHQGKGVGGQLLRAMLDHARGLGCVNAWVLTEKENTAAMRLYAGAGGVAAKKPAVMFEFALSSTGTPGADVADEGGG